MSESLSEMEMPPEPNPDKEPVQAGEPERVPLGQKMAWASTSVTDQLMGNGIGLAMPIYNITLGVNPAHLGYALAIPRVFDAIIDPFIGNLSDNTRSRWGRRRPWIAAGGLLCAVFFTLVWIPPLGLSKFGFLMYFLLTSILYYFGYAVFSIPRQALGYELSTDYHDRTRVMAVNTGFAYAAGFLIPWLYRLSFVGSTASATGSAESNHQVMIGLRYVAVGTSLLIILFTLPTILFCKERAEAQKHPKSDFIGAFRSAITNHPFLIMIGMTFCSSLGVAICGPMNLYVNIYYICEGNRKLGAYYAGIVGNVNSAMGIATIFLTPWLAARLGKKTVIAGGTILAIIGFISSWPMFTPKHPYWQIVPSILYIPGLTVGMILGGSILADICDLDEAESGKRREGMFGAAFACITKAIGAAQTILAGYVLVWVGYQDLPTQTADTIFRLRYWFILCPSVCFLVSVFLLIWLPINEKRIHEVRAMLDARKRNSGANGKEELLVN